MDETLLVILIIIGAIILLYLLLVLLIFIYIKKVKSSLRRKETIINSILAQQYDLIRLLGDMVIKEGVDIPDDLYLSLDLHREQKMKNKSTMEIIDIKKLLTISSSRMIQLAETTPLKDKIKFDEIKSSLLDFSKNYRQEVVLYNQLIGNHNYWIKFLLYRPVSKLFKEKRREPLE